MALTVARKSGIETKPRLIDAQNRIALPSEVLQHLGVKAGDYVSLELVGGEVKVRRVRWEVEK